MRCHFAEGRLTLSSTSSALAAFRTASRLERIPPPAAAICSYEAPSMRFSKSTSRGFTNTGCVCESTKPGSTTLPAQSISVTFLRFFFSHGSRSASLARSNRNNLPADAQNGAVPDDTEFFEVRPATWRSRRDRRVRSWPMLARSTGLCRFALKAENSHAPAV